MKLSIVLAALALTVCASTASAQTKTIETRTTETDIDSLGDGKVVVSETVTSLATSEDVTMRKHMVMLDPIRFVGLFNVGYQYAVTPQVTVGGVLQAPTQLSNAKGWGISAEGRFYPEGKTFRSFHIGGNVTYNDITAMVYRDQFENGEYTGYEYVEEQIQPFAVGVNIGWHWYPWQDFATEIAIGAEYNFEGEENSRDLFGDTIPFLSEAKGIVPSIRFNVGYAW